MVVLGPRCSDLNDPTISVLRPGQGVQQKHIGKLDNGTFRTGWKSVPREFKSFTAWNQQLGLLVL